MTTALITHSDCLNHVNPPGHPERVERLYAINAALKNVSGLTRIEAPMGTDAQIATTHPAAYVERIKASAPADGWTRLDGDTSMSPGSLTAAYRAVGGIVEAVDQVLAGNVRNAFVACRPPGHHAETQTPMGFCIFGNVVIGARHALVNGISRLAIVDFDVHHGNGTQDLVWNDEMIFFVSTHQMPLYPGTGLPSERGTHGNVMNVPLEPGANGATLHKAMERDILPALESYNPEMLFISAGFDAHERDPLANLNWTDEDFGTVTRTLLDFADTHCGGRVVSTLEGGYDLKGLAGGVTAHVTALTEG
ncbi:MAG: histone deacetylase family protein [Rhodobacteraceae bacterium]|nr:histone deacetylase family protein [Paracoccaceae bacterium]